MTGNHNSRERPILFSGPMVRAILEGRKTQTRRIVRNEFGVCAACFADPLTAVPHNQGDGGMGVFGSAPYLRVAHCEHTGYGGGRIRCPQGAVGDRLWVRETWSPVDWLAFGYAKDEPVSIGYAADRSAICHEHDNAHTLDTYAWNWDIVKWKPSIFMPRWACRIKLEIASVRVEKLHEITDEDAAAEGVTGPVCNRIGPGFGKVDHRREFQFLWDKINGKRAAWASNPWVWVVSFKIAQAVARAA